MIFTRLGQPAVANPVGAGPLQAGPLEIGLQLFGPYLLPFEAASVLLLVAMVGAVVLTREK